jgi:hypothetical protein
MSDLIRLVLPRITEKKGVVNPSFLPRNTGIKETTFYSYSTFTSHDEQCLKGNLMGTYSMRESFADVCIANMRHIKLHGFYAHNFVKFRDFIVANVKLETWVEYFNVHQDACVNANLVSGIIFGVIPSECVVLDPRALLRLFCLGYHLYFRDKGEVVDNLDKYVCTWFPYLLYETRNSDIKPENFNTLRAVMLHLFNINKIGAIAEVKTDLKIIRAPRDEYEPDYMKHFNAVAYLERILQAKQKKPNRLSAIPLDADVVVTYFNVLQDMLKSDVPHIVAPKLPVVSDDNIQWNLKPRYLEELISFILRFNRCTIFTPGKRHEKACTGLAQFASTGYKKEFYKLALQRTKICMSDEAYRNNLVYWLLKDMQKLPEAKINVPVPIILQLSKLAVDVGEFNYTFFFDYLFSEEQVFVLRHADYAKTSRIVLAMLLGIVDAKTCVTLDEQVLDQLLSFATDMARHMLSAELGHEKTLAFDEQLFLTKSDPLSQNAIEGVTKANLEAYWLTTQTCMQNVLQVLNACHDRATQDELLAALDAMCNRAEQTVTPAEQYTQCEQLLAAWQAPLQATASSSQAKCSP